MNIAKIMSKKKILILVSVILTFVVCIGIAIYLCFFHNENNQIVEDAEKRSVSERYDNVTLDIIMSTVTTKGVSLFMTDRNDDDFCPYYPYQLKNEYKIQKKFFDKWKDVKLLDNEEIFYRENIYNCSANSKYNRIIDIDWSNIYGELKNGTYRIVQYAVDDNEEFFSNEFSLPDDIDKTENVDGIKLDVLINTISQNGVSTLITDANTMENGADRYAWDDQVYKLQIKNGDNWENLLEREDSIINAIGVIFTKFGPKKDKLNIHSSFSQFYEKVPKGTYRLVKTVLDKSNNSKPIECYSNEFEIEEDYNYTQEEPKETQTIMRADMVNKTVTEIDMYNGTEKVVRQGKKQK